MTKKKVVKKKTSSRKKVVRKEQSVRKKAQPKKSSGEINLKEGKFRTNKLFFSSLVAFAISFILLWISKNDFIDALFGFVMVISLSLVLLSLILELVFWVLGFSKK